MDPLPHQTIRESITALALRFPTLSPAERILVTHRENLNRAVVALRGWDFHMTADEQSNLLTEIFEGRAVPGWSSPLRQSEVLERVALMLGTPEIYKAADVAIGFSAAELVREQLLESLERVRMQHAHRLAQQFEDVLPGEEPLARGLRTGHHQLLGRLADIQALLGGGDHMHLTTKERKEFFSRGGEWITTGRSSEFHELCREYLGRFSTVPKACWWLYLRSTEELRTADLDCCIAAAVGRALPKTTPGQKLVSGPLVHPCSVHSLRQRREGELAVVAREEGTPFEHSTRVLEHIFARAAGFPVVIRPEAAPAGAPYVWRLFHPPASELLDATP